MKKKKHLQERLTTTHLYTKIAKNCQRFFSLPVPELDDLPIGSGEAVPWEDDSLFKVVGNPEISWTNEPQIPVSINMASNGASIKEGSCSQSNETTQYPNYTKKLDIVSV